MRHTLLSLWPGRCLLRWLGPSLKARPVLSSPEYHFPSQSLSFSALDLTGWAKAGHSYVCKKSQSSVVIQHDFTASGSHNGQLQGLLAYDRS